MKHAILTELEHAVLGVIWLEQPCTAYTVRMVFQRSPSGDWTASAGAIYPVVRRLERRRLARSAARSGDRRGTRLYRLTKGGETELRAWLRPPLPPAGDLMNMDPLRLRVRFLGALPRGERLAVVQDAQARLRLLATRLRTEAQSSHVSGDMYGYLVTRGVIRSLRAQVAWLSEVQRELANLAC